MKQLHLLIVMILMLVLPACSSQNGNPVAPPSGVNNESTPVDEFVPHYASDVLYSVSAGNVTAYKAFAAYRIVIDTTTLSGEILPARNAEAIGDTFDADLTQFLIKSPCYNCLKIDGITYMGDSQIKIGFAIKHPFSDILTRPDLHGFDVRGIVVSDGDFSFPDTTVNLSEGGTAAAIANTELVVNPDGYTHHFDKLVENTNYFDPPITGYDANINPYRRYFVDITPGPFDPHNPIGHNVIPVGSGWKTQNYLFNFGSGSTLDFVFILDCAYGQSATFQNRTNPYYFLPEFNRKESWKTEVWKIDDPLTYADNLRAGEPASEAQLRILVSDWQAGLDSYSEYPNTSQLHRISEKSDVNSISIEIPGVTGLLTRNSPDDGDGTAFDPYEFLVNVSNANSAPAGIYTGIVAVRDDLNGQQGPMGIPENPTGFPFEGPEITDYSTYVIFSVRVTGGPPVIDTYNTPSAVFAGDLVEFDIDITEPDGDDLTYLWEQMSPPIPVGNFIDPSVKNAQWQAPSRADIPPAGISFTLKFTVSDIDGQDFQEISFLVNNLNQPPVCQGIETDPIHGVVGAFEPMDIWINTVDPDGNDLNYHWDMDWDGDPGNFDVDETGSPLLNHTFLDQGFYNVGCRITEDRLVDPLSTTCSRMLIQEGVSQDEFKIDDSSENNPHYILHDTTILVEQDGSHVYHASWIDEDDNKVHYSNNRDNPRTFSNHQVIDSGFSPGYSTHSRIAANEQTINVAWIETDTSVPNFIYSLITINSFDEGRTWTAKTTVQAFTNPDIVNYVDICGGIVPGEFYLFYLYKEGGNYYCQVERSNDGGETWGTGGDCRDNVGVDFVFDPTVAVSKTTGIVHTFWKDAFAPATHYYYDWSSNSGVSWHTDEQISNGSNVSSGAMCATDDGSAYFTYVDGSDGTFFLRTTFSGSPTLGPEVEISSLNTVNGISIYASPSGTDGGKTVVIPVTYDLLANYQNRYFYSFDGGLHFYNDMGHSFGATEVDEINCAGIFFDDPDRIEILISWMDFRIASFASAHIYGEYLFLAERF